MKKLLFILAVFYGFHFSAVADTAQIVEAYGKIPLAFSLNQGQTDSQVKFTTAGNGCSMFFAPTGTTFLLSRETAQSAAKRAAKKIAGKPEDMMAARNAEREYESFAVKTVFVGANQNPEMVGENRLPWNNNYFLGSNASKWRTDVPNYGKIRLKEVYSGVDLVYYGNKNRIKYDFVVKPGKDPSKIALRYDLGVNAGNALSVNENGELVVKTPLGNIIERKPYCYQKIDGKEIEVSISYRIIDASINSFGFAIGAFNANFDVYIDPELFYSTFLGGSDDESGYGIAVDSSGNSYVTGYTNVSDYPATIGAYDTSFNGNGDVFVTKLNTDGSALLYSTFIGGGSEDQVYGITLDSSGSAYVTGYTKSSDFPITTGAYDTGFNGYSDAFVTKLNADGKTLLYSTFLGGGNEDQAYGIAVSSSGIAYVTGYTNSSNFPVTTGTYDTSFNGNGDAFVTKLNTDGKTLLYSTFLGGGDEDNGYGITVDSSGNAYVAGRTYSTDYPSTSGAYNTGLYGSSDAFVTKLNSDGKTLAYSTFLGGSGDDQVYGIAVNSSGNTYVAGSTYSSDFPVTTGSYDTVFNENGDAFVTKLNTNGSALVYSTFIGGSDEDLVYGIAVDSSGNACLTGSTYSSDFPVTAEAFDPSFNGEWDIFVTKLDGNGQSLIYSTFIGGSSSDVGSAIGIDSSGNAYVTGITYNTDYPVTSGAYNTSFNGSSDTFVTKLSISGIPTTLTMTSPNGGESWIAGTSHPITWTSSNVTNVKLEYSINGGSSWTTIAGSVSASAGTYSWTIPSSASANCIVRISDVSNSVINDSSDAAFTIMLPVLTMTSPNGGEAWIAGTSHPITWTSANVTNVKLEYSTNGGSSWTTIAGNISAATGSYTWTVPSSASVNCFVRITDVSNSATTDMGNAAFTITLPVLTLTSPNGGEAWIAGSSHPITWTSSGVANVKLDYSTNGGSTWIALSESTSAGSGTYSWTVPFSASANCFVRITDASNSALTDLGNAAFTITLPTLTLTSPNGGESWIAGSSHPITWSSTGVTNVKLDYSTNGGSSWTTIAGSTSASTNTYSWTVPSSASANCFVRITDVSNSAITDMGNAAFTIVLPSLALTSPNGGESWIAGSSHPITWTSTGVTNVKLDYSTNGGSSWTTIADSTAASTNTYSWTIPSSASVNCFVRISDAYNSALNDRSNAAFTLIIPTLALTSPNGGESWIAGSSHPITWSSTGVTDVKLEYSTNGGSSWSTIAGSVSASTNTYAWTVPSSASANCSVRISDVSNSALNDRSNAAFTIIIPTLALTSPNGGESWIAGSSHPITWTSTGVTNVKLEYSTNGGSSWTTIADSTAASANTYSWTVPSSASVNCFVRVSDASNSTLNDRSNAAFIITLPITPTLTLASPNGGESWIAGFSNPITWTSSGVTSVKLEYSTNGGSSWTTIADSTAASANAYSWPIPSSASANCFVRISDAYNSTLNDRSDTAFTIIIPTLTLTSPNGGESWITGSSHPITWTAPGVTNVKLEYSTNGGSSWTTITGSVPASAGTYSWTVPSSASVNCFVRISDASNLTLNDRNNAAFAITLPVLTLTSPNGGESWIAGSSHPITWTSSDVTNVKLEYSTNGGSSWSTITGSSSASTGSYSWTVPSSASADCFVRITDASNSAINDPSNAAFTITLPATPTLTLASPNGGESLIAGSSYPITWTTSGVTNVKLEYSTNGGSSWTTITGSISASTGAYSWTVPSSASASCFVRISDASNSALNDMGNAAFTITLPVTPILTLASPNGGESWIAGSVHPITWSSSGVTNVKLEYSTNGGSSWTTITGSISASTGSYSWTVPSSVSANYFIRITDASNSALNDMSDAAFTITLPTVPTLSLVYPNGGESWIAGSSHTITWSSADVANVKLEYSTNGGSSWTTITGSASANTSAYSWTVPSSASVNCFVRISDASNSALNDMSDTAFTITLPVAPTLTLASPNGGESWIAGSSHGITWTSSGVTNVKLDYSTNGGSSWTAITGSASASAGSYSWTVPSLASANCFVRISDASNPALNDLGNAAFTITLPATPTLALASPNGGESWIAGSSHAITWTSSGVANIKLDYSTNGGSSWTTISGGTSASTGSYSWTVPSSASPNCFVRISDASNPTLNDRGNAAFTITLPVTPTLALASPNGGESWIAGSSHPITWTSESVANVKLEYSTNGGSSWTTITGSASASAGTYSWTVPSSASANCFVRISDASNSSLNDLGNASFAITIPTAPTLALTSPNGGESWIAGSSQTIIWSSENVTNVKLDYSTNGGSSWTTIAGRISASAGSFSWTVPSSASVNCFIRIIDVSNSMLYDRSNAAFTITLPVTPTVALTSPNGGESWIAGSSHPITWISADITNVKLDYSTNGGSSWTTITGSTAASTNSYSWTIPSSASTNCIVRISDTSNSALTDRSNAAFTISLPVIPTIALTYPNGGESWIAGSSHPITWTSAGVTNVKLEYSTDSGSSWTTITGSTAASTNTYSWTVPSSVSANCFVRISDATKSTLNDMSNAAFTITPTVNPTIALVSPNGGESWIAGSSHEITWVGAGITNVKLEYSTDGGSSWTTIAGSITASDGAYSWIVSSVASANCLVRISEASDSAVNDASDTSFTISDIVAWKYQTGNTLYSSPAIGSDGALYMGSINGYLYAINPSGLLKWKYLTGGAIYWSSPAIGSDGVIYVGSNDNYLYAINPGGSLKWKYQTGSVIWSSPAIGSDGVIYVGSKDNYLYAINPDGSLKWQYLTDGLIESSPAIGSNGIIYVGSKDNYVYAINPGGSLKWKFQTGSVVRSSPAIGSDGTIYVGSYDNYLYAINPDGSLEWKYPTGSVIRSSPAIGSDGVVYVGSHDHYVYAINQNGSLRWKFKTYGLVESSPAIGNDNAIYVGSHDNYVYAINQNGSLKWKYLTGYVVLSSPAIGNNGVVYVGSMDRNLYAINSGVTGGLATSAWPKLHRDNQNTGCVSGLQPPSNVTVSDISTDENRNLKLAWTASNSETNEPVSYYRIYRSLTGALSDSVKAISQFTDKKDVISWEQNAAVLVDSVASWKTDYTDTAVFLADVPYYYWIQAVGAGRESARTAASISTVMEKRNSIQAAFHLNEARPNPFNPSTTIEYSLSRDTRVLLRVYNISGQKVATLTDGIISAGQHSVVWDAKGMPSGVYFYTLSTTGGFSETKKVLLLK